MSVITFPPNGETPTPPRDDGRNVRAALSGLEGPIAEIGAAMWLLTTLDHGPAGNERDDARAYIEDRLLDHVSSLRGAFEAAWHGTKSGGDSKGDE